MCLICVAYRQTLGIIIICVITVECNILRVDLDMLWVRQRSLCRLIVASLPAEY